MPTRLATLIALLLLSAQLAAGCGGDAASEPPASTRGEVEYETEPVPDLTVDLRRAWRSAAACALPAGASRGGCDVGRYRCVATRTGRGTSVSCARPGESISFLLPR